jgi:methyl-accepting chemotaxis protein
VRIVERSGLLPEELPAAEDLTARISAVVRGDEGAQSVDSLLAHVDSTLTGFADSEAAAGRWMDFMRETRAVMIAMTDAAAGISAMASLIGAIDEISVTVNLVSQNAFIEASHAGELGRGFAIIAKEIKKHAESTQSKANEIMKSIEVVMEKVDLTKREGQQSLESYREEEEGVNLLLETFTAITRDMGVLAEAGRKILQTMQS